MLEPKIKAFVKPVSEFYRQRPYWWSYQSICAKRFLIENSISFLFQFLLILNLKFSLPLPIYPPMGLAFTLFYLMGNKIGFGLFLGGVFGYHLQNFTTISTLLYLCADLGGGCLGAYWCQTILTADVRPFVKVKQNIEFIKIIAFRICPLTSGIRLVGMWLNHTEFEFQNNIVIDTLLYYLIFWLADLNSIIIFSGFLLSWVYTFYAREKISPFPIVTFIVLILCLIFLFHPHNMIGIMAIAMLLSVFWAVIFGYLVSTFLMFVLSMGYLILFLTKILQDQISNLLIAILGSCALLLYAIAMLKIGYHKIRSS